ncbi:MAG: hypothetical protein AAFY59_16120 [Pseudomonadota bacterium]
MGAILGFLIALVLILPPYWKLWTRTGHSGWWSLLIFVPIANIVMPFWLAFKRWPAEEGSRDVSERF